jgi:hypothetical protein
MLRNFVIGIAIGALAGTCFFGSTPKEATISSIDQNTYGYHVEFDLSDAPNPAYSGHPLSFEFLNE